MTIVKQLLANNFIYIKLDNKTANFELGIGEPYVVSENAIEIYGTLDGIINSSLYVAQVLSTQLRKSIPYGVKRIIYKQTPTSTGAVIDVSDLKIINKVDKSVEGKIMLPIYDYSSPFKFNTNKLMSSIYLLANTNNFEQSLNDYTIPEIVSILNSLDSTIPEFNLINTKDKNTLIKVLYRKLKNIKKDDYNMILSNGAYLMKSVNNRNYCRPNRNEIIVAYTDFFKNTSYFEYRQVDDIEALLREAKQNKVKEVTITNGLLSHPCISNPQLETSLNIASLV